MFTKAKTIKEIPAPTRLKNSNLFIFKSLKLAIEKLEIVAPRLPIESKIPNPVGPNSNISLAITGARVSNPHTKIATANIIRSKY